MGSFLSTSSSPPIKKTKHQGRSLANSGTTPKRPTKSELAAIHEKRARKAVHPALASAHKKRYKRNHAYDECDREYDRKWDLIAKDWVN